MTHCSISEELNDFRIYFGLCLIYFIKIRYKLCGIYEPHFYVYLVHHETFLKTTNTYLV